MNRACYAHLTPPLDGTVLNNYQDILQRKLDEVYKDIPNLMGIADNIVVCGSTESEHEHSQTQSEPEL